MNGDARGSYDAVIVGARCAGAATALLLARAGLRVLAVDRGRYGSDTLSTHALMRGAVMQLERWGLLGQVVAAGTPAVRMTTFTYGDEVVPIEVSPALYAPRRTVLDRLLVDAARDAGADVLHGVRLAELSRDAAGRVTGAVLESAGAGRRHVEAGVVIGADGAHSTFADIVGTEVVARGDSTTGVVYAYVDGIADRGYRWYYRPGVSAGAIPTNDGGTCVFVSVPAARFHDELRVDLDAGFRRVLEESAPGLAAEVGRGRRVGRLHGYGGMRGFLRRPCGPGWALVGDAGWFRDPLTAHGITDALRDAEFLARAVVAGSDEAYDDYRRTRDDLALPMMELSDRVASFDWSLAEIQAEHLLLSREMKREVAAIRALDATALRQPVSRAARSLRPLPRCSTTRASTTEMPSGLAMTGLTSISRISG